MNEDMVKLCKAESGHLFENNFLRINALNFFVEAELQTLHLVIQNGLQ